MALKKTDDGIELVARYYEIAPKIVAAIDQKDNRLDIYDRIYAELVLPCIEMIDRGDYEGALALYQNATIRLEMAYC